MGRVLDVDPSKWTMVVRAMVGEETFYDVPLTSLYTHPYAGEGMHFIPEPGAYVWICRPSEGDSRPFPLIYHPLPDETASQRANRPSMNPGDICFQTRDRNGIRVRRGGVVEVYSTSIARTYYIPNKNRILTFAENWELETFGGHLRWNTARPEEDPNGLKSTKLDLSVKEFADHPEPAVRLQVGGGIEEGPQILDLRVFQDSTIDPEDEPLRESVSLTADREGNLVLKTYQPAPGSAEEDLEQSVGIAINNSGELKVQLATGGQVAIFEDEVNTEGVILGKTFLQKLQASLTEIQTVINGLGILTPNTLQLLTDIATSVGPNKGGAPLISTRTRTE
jgi:hypothetical protein